MKLIKLLFVLVFLQACVNDKSSHNIDDFIKKINVEKWNSNSKDFIVKKCDIKKDSIATNDINLKFKRFFENRMIMLDSLIKNTKSLGSKIDTLVVNESYFDTSTFKSSFFVMNNYEEKQVVVYMKDNEIDGFNVKEEAFKDEEYYKNLKNNSKCFNELRGYINSATFATIFYLDDLGNLNMETKDIYLGTMMD